MPFFFLLVLFLSGGRFHATSLATKSIMDFESKKILVSVSSKLAALKSSTALHIILRFFGAVGNSHSLSFLRAGTSPH